MSLIGDRPVSIVEELSLIESLAMLDGFGISMLPVQGQFVCDLTLVVTFVLSAHVFGSVDSGAESDRRSTQSHVQEFTKGWLRSLLYSLWLMLKKLCQSSISKQFYNIQLMTYLI